MMRKACGSKVCGSQRVATQALRLAWNLNPNRNPDPNRNHNPIFTLTLTLTLILTLD